VLGASALLTSLNVPKVVKGGPGIGQQARLFQLEPVSLITSLLADQTCQRIKQALQPHDYDQDPNLEAYLVSFLDVCFVLRGSRVAYISYTVCE
jgi:hypothetical protein